MYSWLRLVWVENGWLWEQTGLLEQSRPLTSSSSSSSLPLIDHQCLHAAASLSCHWFVVCCFTTLIFNDWIVPLLLKLQTCSTDFTFILQPFSPLWLSGAVRGGGGGGGEVWTTACSCADGVCRCCWALQPQTGSLLLLLLLVYLVSSRSELLNWISESFLFKLSPMSSPNTTNIYHTDFLRWDKRRSVVYSSWSQPSARQLPSCPVRANVLCWLQVWILVSPSPSSEEAASPHLPPHRPAGASERLRPDSIWNKTSLFGGCFLSGVPAGALWRFRLCGVRRLDSALCWPRTVFLVIWSHPPVSLCHLPLVFMFVLHFSTESPNRQNCNERFISQVDLNTSINPNINGLDFWFKLLLVVNVLVYLHRPVI